MLADRYSGKLRIGPFVIQEGFLLINTLGPLAYIITLLLKSLDWTLAPVIAGFAALCLASQHPLGQWSYAALIIGNGVLLSLNYTHLPVVFGIVLFYVLILHASVRLDSWLATLGVAAALLGLFAAGAGSTVDGNVIRVQIAAFIIQAFLSKALIASRSRLERFNSELQTTTSSLQHVLDLSPDLIVTIDMEKRFVNVSRAFRGLLGYSPTAFVGRIFTDIVHPDDREMTISTLYSLPVGSVVNKRNRCLRRDGTAIWTDWRVVRDNHTLHCVIRDITAQKSVEDKLAYQAFHDTLTGLPNRACFLEHLHHEMLSANSETKATVLYLDLDNFKTINDTLGHIAGDALLQNVAHRLRSCKDEKDMVARLGGDEFAFYLHDMSTDGVAAVVDRINTALRPAIMLEGKSVYVTASIGIAIATTGMSDPQKLLQAADVALYRSKAKGRGRYTVFDQSMSANALQRLELQAELRQGIPKGELMLNYQPIVELSSENVSGFEALVRWCHPQRGLLSPNLFIPIAQEAGIDMEIDKWVLRTACGQMAAWIERYPHAQGMYISVNLASSICERDDLCDVVTGILTETGLLPQNLQLEILETTILKYSRIVAREMNKLAKIGVRLAVDDFGAGYSSIAYLHQYPISVLKVDQSYTRDLGQQDGASIAEAIIAFAKTLGLTVLMEGIETEHESMQVQRLSCNLGQGFYYAKPLSEKAATAVLGGVPLSEAADA